MWVVIQLTTALDGTTGDETYKVDLQTDSVEGFTSPTVIGSVNFTRGDPVGTRKVIGFPITNEEFLRLNYVLGGTTPIGGFSAWLTDQESSQIGRAHV